MAWAQAQSQARTWEITIATTYMNVAIRAQASRFRTMECASGKRSLDAFTSCEIGEETSVAQPGSKTKQRRVTATVLVADSQ